MMMDSTPDTTSRERTPNMRKMKLLLKLCGLFILVRLSTNPEERRMLMLKSEYGRANEEEKKILEQLFSINKKPDADDMDDDDGPATGGFDASRSSNSAMKKKNQPSAAAHIVGGTTTQATTKIGGRSNNDVEGTNIRNTLLRMAPQIPLVARAFLYYLYPLAGHKSEKEDNNIKRTQSRRRITDIELIDGYDDDADFQVVASTAYKLRNPRRRITDLESYDEYYNNLKEDGNDNNNNNEGSGGDKIRRLGHPHP